MKISSVSPLLFNIESNNFELPISYVQKFARADLPVLIQIVDLPGMSYSMTLKNLYVGSTINISPQKFTINEYNTLYEFSINPSNGTYKAYIYDGKGGQSESITFCIHDSISSNSMKIEYTNQNNMEAFGAVFEVNGLKRSFSIRVEGGFKSDSKQLAVENEQFRTQRQVPINLFSVPYEKRTLSIGDNEGVPFEIARLINNIFCLSSIKLNGVSYTRSESSVPEQKSIAEFWQQYNYSLVVENTENISYSGYTEYPDGSGIVGEISINVNNAKDGQILVFNGEEGTFINQSHHESI